MKTLVLIVAFLPLLAFLAVAIVELSSDRRWSEKVIAVSPVVLGIGAFFLFLYGFKAFPMTPAFSLTLSRVMTIFSAAIACSGVFITYSRRTSAILLACGGLLMASFRMFNRIVV